MRTTIIRIQLNNNPIRKNIKNLPITPLTRRGTGKTYASAFAARELEFKRVLFLVHRNQIAKQALKSYRKVFDRKVSMGTGKTYASAFAARELEFKRVLFLVHRNQIAKQALKSYRKVFDRKVSMGMVTGKYQNYDADFVFATVQTMSKEEKW